MLPDLCPILRLVNHYIFGLFTSLPITFCFMLMLMECDLSHRAVNTALWCNFLVFSLKFGVWLSTSSHVMLAELVHSVADFANQVVDASTFAIFFCKLC